MRKVYSVNTGWSFIKKDISPESFKNEKFESVKLPHTWNALDGQDGGADYYRGACWYYNKLGKLTKSENEAVYLEFEGVSSIADVYLNGALIAHHEGGFSTFRVRIDDKLGGGNELLVRVDNSPNNIVYPQMADFTFFGGIYRNVNLIFTNKTHFELEYYGGDGIMITPTIEGDHARVKVRGFVCGHSGQKIHYTVCDADGQEVAARESGDADAEIIIESPKLWDGIKSPYLYTLKAEIKEGCEVLDDKIIFFGIRSFFVDPQRGFILNGRPYPLRGISRHQDRLDKGWALSREDHIEDMALISELGANTVRLAHYQHDKLFYHLCDLYGMCVWAEIPYISSHMPAANDNVLSQMKELIIQNYNHPSIVTWGLSNEITIGGETEDLIKRHKELNDLVHSLDPTRPTVMAAVSMLEESSEMNKISDILSYNHYFGWYGGEFSDNEKWLDSFHEKYPERALGLSEYGCEAITAWHSSAPEQGDYTEEYQCMYHHHMLKVFESRPWLWATHVWNMFDFAADARDEGGCKGRNNKGLVSYDRKTRKDSFYLYKAYWTEEPMLHIAGKRYVNRPDEITKVTVYSNLPEVALYVNGELLQKKSGDRVFEFEFKLPEGKTEIKAAAGGLSDSSVIVKTDKPDPSYSFESSGAGVSNWFGKGGEALDMTYDRNYFCIKDKISDIMQDPRGGAVIESMMKQFMGGEGGEVAGFKLTPAMMKMMGSFSVERVAKMAGDKLPPEMICSINKELQTIEK